MGNRLDLQAALEELLGSDHVYFQPPANIAMRYPAIVYELAKLSSAFADDRVYKKARAYQVTLIDKNPDSEFFDKIAALPMCGFDRSFKSDNLNHYVFTLYY